MASVACSIDPNTGKPKDCDAASENNSGMFIEANPTNLGSETPTNNLSSFKWGRDNTNMLATNPDSNYQEYSDLNFKVVSIY